MKTNHLLIIETEAPTLSSRYYKVSAGTGKQDEADLAYINLYAAIHNYFFEEWNDTVASFIQQIAQSFGVTILDLNIHHISAHSMVQYMMQHGEPPKKPLLTPHQEKIRSMFRPSSYYQRQINVIRHAEAEQRKKPKVKSDSAKGLN